MQIVNLSSYKFIELKDLVLLRKRMIQHCMAIGLKGTIQLSPEGLNVNVAGERDVVEKFKTFMARDARFADMQFKESISEYAPFSRMLVRLKKEVIKMGRSHLDMENNDAQTVSPQQLKQWLDEQKDVVLLDTRNQYETEIGSFKQAKLLPIDVFSDLPDYIKAHPELLPKDKPVVSFCTGGVRCEKVVPILKEMGYDNIFQLGGGILKYFEECGGAHWDGECFVFDDRIAVDPELNETETTLCNVCQMPLTLEQQASADYIPDESCPYCIHQDKAAVGRF